MKRKIMTTLATLLALTLLLTACGQVTPTPAADNGAVGSVLLSLNPEIEIEYDRNGIVVELEGLNQDGKDILLGYVSFEGKPVKQVMAELVEDIYASGAYQLELDGNAKNIVVKLLEGSEYPSEDFLEEVADSIRLVVADQGSTGETVVVDKTDLTEQGLIGLEKAKELVLAQLGLSEADFTNKEYELDDGIYELEFTVDGTEYEYKVHSITGKILKAEAAPDDDRPLPPVLPPVTAPPTTAPVTTMTVEEAKAIVFAYLGIPAEQVSRLEVDFERGKFELEFVFDGMEYDIDVDTTTGAITKLHKEKDDDRPIPPTPTEPAAPAALTPEEIKTLIFAHLGITEDQVRQLEVEMDDGKFEVDFKVGNLEYEFEVDITGKILKIDKEIDD